VYRMSCIDRTIQPKRKRSHLDDPPEVSREQWNESQNLMAFKRKVRERDNYTCQVCGEHGKIVHHLRSFARHPWLRLEPDNAKCMCPECHDEFHKIYGYKNNFPDQFYKFRDMKSPI
jgi:hypothetical protein